MPGNLYVVAAPSGAGKTSLVRALLALEPALRLSVSHTTRAPRAGEENGKSYHFVDRADFEQRVSHGDFLEWAEVHGNYYGTSKAWIAAEMAAERDVLLEIDWQGAQQVRAIFPGAISIFILPPSLEALEQRLAGRGTDSAAVISRRMAAAQGEMRHVTEFDYVIINDDFETALLDLRSLVRTARLGVKAQRSRHAGLFSRLI